MVPAAEWKYFMDDGEMSRAPKGRMKAVFENVRRVFDALGRKVTQYEPGKELAPGITSVATPGHTPGHTSFIVASGNSKVFVQADVTHVPSLFVRNPGWQRFFDQDGAMAEATRRKVYDMLAAEKMMVQGYHYPFPALAYIEKSRHRLSLKCRCRGVRRSSRERLATGEGRRRRRPSFLFRQPHCDPLTFAPSPRIWRHQ